MKNHNFDVKDIDKKIDIIGSIVLDNNSMIEFQNNA